MGSKFRLALAGLTAAALIGGVMVADPADAGKKKHKKVKVKKVKKGNSVKQVSKGGNAKAGNGGNGGSGGSSGMVNNTGNVNGGLVPGPGAGLPADFVACVTAAAATGDVLVDSDELVPCEEAAALAPALIAAFRACLGPPAGDELLFWSEAAVVACLAPTVPGPGGAVFSGDAGDGAAGGNGGDATGGIGGANTNISTRTVTSDDHSIDVDG